MDNMQPATHTCKNCGNTFTGKFCNACGEKVYAEHDKKVTHLFEEVFHFITHFEGSFFTTLKTVLTKPGRLSADYCAGIRKKYFKPISLLLILVILYLLFPFFEGLNMKYSTYVSDEYNYSWFAVPTAKKKVYSHAITEKELAERYDKKSPTFAKLLILILIPLSAFALLFLFPGAKRFFFDHFILATEIIAFIIFVIFLALPLLVFIVLKISPSLRYIFHDNSWFAYMVFTAVGVYISIAFRNFYKQKRWISFIKAVIFWLVFMFGIQYVYRFLLYYLIMLFI